MADNMFTNGFDVDSLVTAINKAPFAPGVLSRAKLFKEEPVNTTQVSIEQVDNQLTLVPSRPRGAPPDVHPDSTRKLIQLTAPHLVSRSTMLAATWQDRRGFGESNPADIMKERDRVLAEMRQRLELTIERICASALNGAVLDADGSTMVDLFSAFDVAQNTQAMALATTTTDVVGMLMSAKRKAEAELDVPVPKWAAFASPSFMDALRNHPKVGDILVGWAAADDLRKDSREGFSIGGVIFTELAPVAGVDFIPADVGFLCPLVPNLYRTYFAPADYMDSVNKDALPMYARAEPLEFNRGIRIESQSNPISVVTRPRAVIRLNA